MGHGVEAPPELWLLLGAAAAVYAGIALLNVRRDLPPLQSGPRRMVTSRHA
jgi:hypothetical protein